MASKKGGGSTSNGRDSHSKRLGVKLIAVFFILTLSLKMEGDSIT